MPGILFFTTPPETRVPPGDPASRSTRRPVISDRTALDLASFGPVDLHEQPTRPTTPVQAEATVPDIYHETHCAGAHHALPVQAGWVPVEVDDDLDEITATDGGTFHPDYVVSLRARLTAATSDAAYLRTQVADANSRHAHAREVADGRIRELTQSLHTATGYNHSAEAEAVRLQNDLATVTKLKAHIEGRYDQLRDDYDALRVQWGDARAALSRQADVVTRQEDVIAGLRSHLQSATRDLNLLRALPAPEVTPQQPCSPGFFGGLLRHLLGSPA